MSKHERELTHADSARKQTFLKKQGNGLLTVSAQNRPVLKTDIPYNITVGMFTKELITCLLTLFASLILGAFVLIFRDFCTIARFEILGACNYST